MGLGNLGQAVTLNLCQAGHTWHSAKQIRSDFGEWLIWDWERYMDFPGYCSGQDEVSKSIDINKAWERWDTNRMLWVLETPGLVLDFGSHIGWFALQAAEQGCDVFAVDSDPENMRLLHLNADLRGVQPWETWTAWARDIVLPAEVDDGVRFVKVDIEGREHDVLDLTRDLWKHQKIDYGLWELSPIFEDRQGIMAQSYADLVDEIASYGYRWVILKDEGEWEITGADLTFPQENAWCIRR